LARGRFVSQRFTPKTTGVNPEPNTFITKHATTDRRQTRLPAETA
jgi:hypothetical protein